MKWKKNKKSIFRVNFLKIILPLLILIVIIFVFLVMRSNLFTIKSIDIHAEKVGCVDNNQIKNSSNLLGQNFFFINSLKVESILKKQFICIKSVETFRNFPNKVKLSVFGRVPTAILVQLKSPEATLSGELENFTEVQATPSAEATTSAENFVIDNEGVIYSHNIEQIDAPKVYVSGLGELGNALKILQKVNIFGVEVKDAKIYSEKIILLNGMPRIIFKLDGKIDTQTASLQLILDKAKIDDENIEFIDLRFDKPVVKFAPKKK